MDFRERTGHNGVVRCRDKLNASLIVVVPHVLGVGRVENKQNIVRQLSAQGPHLVERDVRARWVIGVGYEHGPRLRRYTRYYFANVSPEICLGRHNRSGPISKNNYAIEQEAVLRVYRFITRPKICLRQ